MMHSFGFDWGLGAIWMILIWVLPVVAVVALVAGLAKNKAWKGAL